MKRPIEIAQEEQDMSTIVNLTTAFEGIASMRISQIKDQVLQSTEFFAELWKIYTQLRVDSLFRFGRVEEDEVIDKDLFIAITAESGFSGDIDQKLLDWMLTQYDPKRQDLILIGHHGAIQLAQAGVPFKKYYKLPEKDRDINVTPLVKYVRQYRSTSVFYQTYISLMVQDIKKIEVQKSVIEAGDKVKETGDVIDETTYIFEPSNYAVIAHLERSMVEITLSQLILESKLAQYASRFRSMSAAKDKSRESWEELHVSYNRTKRQMTDERLKEIINGMRKAIGV